jgi:hypothetical protein
MLLGFDANDGNLGEERVLVSSGSNAKTLGARVQSLE